MQTKESANLKRLSIGKITGITIKSLKRRGYRREMKRIIKNIESKQPIKSNQNYSSRDDHRISCAVY